MYIALDKETAYRLYEPGERTHDLSDYQAEIQRFIQNPTSNILVAEDTSTGLLVGYLQAIGRPQKRIRHVISINIAILQSHTGQGLGWRLFSELEAWAGTAGICRMDLTVMKNNPNAQKLYHKLGFAVEGIKKCSMLVDGVFIDEIYMAKWIGPNQAN